MHPSSYLKFEAFLDEYLAESPSSGQKSVLDIGSAAVRKHLTYRIPAETRGLRYVGLDMQAGPNVDILAKNPVVYSEVPNESHDFIISGQAFEHNPFFWVSFCEMARILKQDGLMLVIAPSAGPVHRHPFDCWRYYPDSWMALCAISGLQLEELIFEPDGHRQLVSGARWRDSAVVARKPTFGSEQEKSAFYDRISSFTAPFKAEIFSLAVVDQNNGPVFSRYTDMVRTKATAVAGKCSAR